MFYSFLKIFANLAIKFYCRNIIINKKDLLKCEGPILLAVNHPNSFLDAIILCTLFKNPINSLARGDAFKQKLASIFLRSLKILPVYRTSEGFENLDHNYTTFEKCLQIFEKNGMVLIFSEGLCLNEWHLRPLKKGTARVAIAAWQKNIPLKILPIGINYNNFHSFGKSVHINIGNFIEQKDLNDITNENSRLLNEVTNLIKQQLHTLVYEIGVHDQEKWTSKLYTPINKLNLFFFAIPSLMGKLLHFPLYYPIKKIVAKKALYSSHYDSIMVALLLFTYPIYLTICSIIIYLFFGGYYYGLVFILFPFCAWCFIKTKPQSN